jgi:predicted nucleic acid-binding protein
MQNAKTGCFVDSNVLVYSADPAVPEKQEIAQDLLRSLINSGMLVLSAQSLNECYAVLIRKRGLAAAAFARGYVENYSAFCTAPYDFRVTQRAWRIQNEHGFSWWDCVLLASGSMAECSIFFSEDLQHRRKVDQMTIVNPFLGHAD